MTDRESVPEILYGVPTQEEYAAAQKRAGRRGVIVLPEEMRESLVASGAWSTPVIQSTTPVPAVATDEPVHVNPEDYVTMAEEPIEERLRRAYENGLKQGLELGHRAFGQWDHR